MGLRMRLGLLTGDHKQKATPQYWHRAPHDDAPTYCGIHGKAVPSGPPPRGTPECPICARA